MRSKGLLGVALMLVTLSACTQQSMGVVPQDPRSHATRLYETHMRADDAFASFEAPTDCPTHFVSYGTKRSATRVVDYFRTRDLEERNGLPNDFGNRPIWTAEQSRDSVVESQVDVWVGSDAGHHEWTSVFTIATAQCDLTASASYSVDPRRAVTHIMPRAELVNSGDLDIEYGVDYQIQQRVSGRWRDVSFGKDQGIRCDFPSIALTLQPGESDKHRISFCDDARRFEPGVYRVMKTISFESYDESTLRAQFTITRKKPSPKK